VCAAGVSIKQQTFNYPELSPITQISDFANSYLLPVDKADNGFVITNGASTPSLLYASFNFASTESTGNVVTDSTTAYYSTGLSVGDSAFPNQSVGPCVYVAGYRTKKDGQYTTLSQVRVGSSAEAGQLTIEAQVTTTANLLKTVIANDNYLFAIFGEIMYRWKVQC
jgi:hypothetical protein